MTATPQASAALQRHIQALRVEIGAAEAKRQRLDAAITKKRGTLSRLEARLVLSDNAAARARPPDA